MSLPIPQFVSPEYPIRVAIGKLGYPASLIQSLEDDMVEWVNEAARLIKKNRGVVKYHTEEVTVYDNQVAHCPGAAAVVCVEYEGAPMGYRSGPSCSVAATDKCRKYRCCSGKEFTFNECYIQFIPSLPDGAKVKVTWLVRAQSETGFNMVPEVCVTAIAEYVKWMLCNRERDNRAGQCERRWYDLCRIARAELNGDQWTQANIEKFGYIWW